MSSGAQQYLGHTYDVTPESPLPGVEEIAVDGERLRFGRLPDGSFYLHRYAYDWQGDLETLARRYVEDLERDTPAARPGQA